MNKKRERGHIIILPLSFSSYSHELSVDLSKVTSELEQARKQLQHMKDSSVNDNSEMEAYIQVLLYTHTCLVFTISSISSNAFTAAFIFILSIYTHCFLGNEYRDHWTIRRYCKEERRDKTPAGTDDVTTGRIKKKRKSN